MIKQILNTKKWPMHKMTQRLPFIGTTNQGNSIVKNLDEAQKAGVAVALRNISDGGTTNKNF